MSGSLNDAQRRAVEYDAGPLVVLAGPGTGKTRVIVHRVAHMINQRGIEPERICAMTFTNKAAEELRERLAGLVGSSTADAVYAGTFHKFGLQLLRRFADLAGLPSSPQILDSAQTRRLVRSLIADHGLFHDALGAGVSAIIAEAEQAISELRNAGLEPDEVRARVDGLLARPGLEAGPRAELERFSEHVRLYELYDRACAERGMVSVDDLITRPTRLLREHALAREICRHDYAHVVVDEFQDLNQAQIRLLIQLCRPDDPDLCVVGDDDQAIYAFRGADEFAFLRFQEAWPTAHRVLLTENWRSGQGVVDCANAIIAESATRFAPDKVIELPAAHAKAESCVEFVDAGDGAETHDAIAAMILLDRHEHPDRPLSQYAVLGRTNSEVERVADALELEGIPVLVLRSPKATDDEGVQDLLAWISLVLEPEQTWAARRLLSRPPFGVDPLRVGRYERAYQAEGTRLPEGERMPAFAEWLCERYADDAHIAPHAVRLRDLSRAFAASASSESADRTVHRIITEAGLVHADLPGGRTRAQRIEALVSVLRFVRERLPRLEQPRDLAAFRRYYDDLDDKEQGFASLLDTSVNGPESEGIGAGDGVRIFTAHASKGLEFDTVFLPRCCPPHGYPKTRRDDRSVTPDAILSDRDKPAPIEEERRVFYVACTRAQRRLVMLGKSTKGKPGPTHMALPLVFAGLVPRQDAADVIARAAEAGLGRFAQEIERTELDRKEEASRRALLARARQRARTEASLALDAADRSDVDADQLARVFKRLEQSARMIAGIASVEAGFTPPQDLIAGAGDFVSQLREQLDQLPGPGEGDLYRAPRPPLYLSYTSINEYLRCPRCWYVRNVLRLPEEVGAPMRVGDVVHRTLERFYALWRDADAEGRDLPGLDALLTIGRKAYNEAHQPDEPLDADEQLQVLAQLRTMFEKLHDERTHPLELEKRVELPYEHAGNKHRLIAKLDRIDRTPGGLRIVDYKTGYASKKLLEPAADDLQLGIYAMALEHLYEGESLEGTAEYWLLAEGQIGSLPLNAINHEKVRSKINQAIDGILAGAFPKGEHDREGAGLCNVLDVVARDDMETA